MPRPRPKFGHGIEVAVDDRTTLLLSFHPSQQNTFTGKLTKEMFAGVFERARVLSD
jgi:uracil-DNA glycosylase